MTATHVIGVDPGKSGALACLTIDGRLISVFDMPTVGTTVSGALLHNWVAPSPRLRYVAVVEDVHAMPGQGVTSMFTFGRAIGVIEGVLAANQIPTHYVSPQRWKRDLGLGKDKSASRQRACQLWPDNAHLFARIKDDGRAEAALIARWWINNNKENKKQ